MSAPNNIDRSNNTRSKQRQWLVALVSALLWACGQRQNPILDVSLEDGRVIRDLTASDLPTAILVYDATTCLYCSTPLPHWEELARQHRIHLILLIAGKLSDAHRRAFIVQRIPVTGILKDPSRTSVPIPSEYLVRGPEIMASAEGFREIRTRRLWQHAILQAADTGQVGEVQEDW